MKSTSGKRARSKSKPTKSTPTPAAETPKTRIYTIDATIETYTVDKHGKETDHHWVGWLARLEFDSDIGYGDAEVISPRGRRRRFATEAEAFEEAEAVLTRRLYPE